MDTSASEIEFNSLGQCNFCTSAIKTTSKIIREDYFKIWASAIKSGLDKTSENFHGVIGLSGGLDSSFLLHKLVEAGIRPLVVHVDAGWNSQEASNNIYKLIDKLELTLETIVIDWYLMRNLQLAFLNSGIKNQDIPQDYIFFSTLYDFTENCGLKNIFLGSNYSTESILPKSWGEGALDYKILRSINDKFGTDRTIQLKKIDPLSLLINTVIKKKYVIHRPLNYMPYSKQNALEILKDKYEWNDYSGKHKESIFTAYFQDVYLPKRFEICKAKAHLSSLVVNGELSRDQALDLLKTNIIDPIQAQRIRLQVANKLEVSIHELDSFENLAINSKINYRQSNIKNLLVVSLTKIFIIIRIFFKK
jgi:hypothetical protein